MQHHGVKPRLSGPARGQPQGGKRLLRRRFCGERWRSHCARTRGPRTAPGRCNSRSVGRKSQLLRILRPIRVRRRSCASSRPKPLPSDKQLRNRAAGASKQRLGDAGHWANGAKRTMSRALPSSAGPRVCTFVRGLGASRFQGAWHSRNEQSLPVHPSKHLHARLLACLEPTNSQMPRPLHLRSQGSPERAPTARSATEAASRPGMSGSDASSTRVLAAGLACHKNVLCLVHLSSGVGAPSLGWHSGGDRPSLRVSACSARWRNRRVSQQWARPSAEA